MPDPVVPPEGTPAADATAAAAAAPSVVADAPAVVADAPPAAEAPPARRPTLAAEAQVDPPAEAPPAEVPPVEKPADAPADSPAADAPPAEAPPVEAAPFEYKYELAEDMTLSDERRSELHAIFDAIRQDPTNMQPLMDLHHQVLQETVQQIQTQATQHQLEVWSQTTDGWHKEVLADPMIGGAGHQTAMRRVALARDTFMSDHPRDSAEWKADQEAMVDFLNITGAGDHPVFNRMMYRIGQFLKEPTTASIPQDTRPAPQETGGRRGAVLHDNPRSREINGRG